MVWDASSKRIADTLVALPPAGTEGDTPPGAGAAGCAGAATVAVVAPELPWE